MATAVSNKSFVDQVIKEIVAPAADQLMANRFFTDLRAGTLTTRRLQGFSLQHTWFNRSLLKSGALRMIKASSDNDAFMSAVRGIVGEFTHPDMCKKFGLSLGLTEEDFATELPIYEVLLHTSVIAAAPLIVGNNAAGRTSGMTNEFILQRYATEMADYLAKPPYNMSKDALQFFIVHGVVDVEHSREAAEDVVRLASSDLDLELVRYTAKNMVKLKLAKFEGIYDHYARA